MTTAMVVRWTTPYPGREAAAVAYGREVDDFWGKKASDGLCTPPKWFWGMGGDNYWFVEGDNGNLLGILATKEAQELLTKGGILIQDFSYGLYTVGREEMLATYEHALADLKIR